MPYLGLELTPEDNKYRQELRTYFTTCITKTNENYRKHHPCSTVCGDMAKHFEDSCMKTAAQEKQQIDLGLQENHSKFQMDQAKSSGGDADRYYNENLRPCTFSGDSSRYNHELSQSQRHFLCSSTSHDVSKPTYKARTGADKFPTYTPLATAAEELIGGEKFRFENVSNLGDICNGSEGGSSKSQKSSKTVVSRKSSHELKKLVRSKCKLQEAIDNTLQDMCKIDNIDKCQNDINNALFDKPGMQLDTLSPSHCKHCTDKSHSLQLSQKDVTTEIGKADFAEDHCGDTLTMSVDDVVNSKVINPMIRKLQRMYLNNLKEEMSLMEDLERLPHKVNEVYKAATIMQRR